jgi:N6-L-threonylcarbamoyladenine synthase/protein kinase Bud32
MCDQRGADFFAPENRFLRDNAGMIAVLGAKMYANGDTLDIEASGIDSNFRPDQVSVTWREADEQSNLRTAQAKDEPVTGAEATVSIKDDRVIKRRNPREYRHPTLDTRLRKERTRQEARLTREAREVGVPTPLILDIDVEATTLVFQYVGDWDLREALTSEHVEMTAKHLARVHNAGFVHGDPTTRNVRVADRENSTQLFLIDFGLGYYTDDAEDYAMDLHVLSQSLAGTHDDADRLMDAAESAYATVGAESVLDQLQEIEGRGRYQ